MVRKLLVTDTLPRFLPLLLHGLPRLPVASAPFAPAFRPRCRPGATPVGEVGRLSLGTGRRGSDGGRDTLVCCTTLAAPRQSSRRGPGGGGGRRETRRRRTGRGIGPSGGRRHPRPPATSRGEVPVPVSAVLLPPLLPRVHTSDGFESDSRPSSDASGGSSYPLSSCAPGTNARACHTARSLSPTGQTPSCPR